MESCVMSKTLNSETTRFDTRIAIPSTDSSQDDDVFTLAIGTQTPVLAIGGDLKARACLLTGRTATMGQCIGNINDPTRYRAYCDVIDGLTEQLGSNAKLVAHDLHPNYLSTRLALRMGLPTIGVQHHHAHIVSVMAEQRLTKPVIGICCDGAGFGTDDALWGCEVMHCHAGGFKRMGHLEYFPLLGDDAAAIETWRPALALVQQALGDDWRHATSRQFSLTPQDELNALSRLLESKLPLHQTSSLGRVFDGVSFLLGICNKNTHEAEAAIALERATTCEHVDPYPYETRAGRDGVLMSLSPALRAILCDSRDRVPVSRIANRFHESVARMLAATAIMAAEEVGVRTIVLAGGCFANAHLRTRVTSRLQQRHYDVAVPLRLPFGDAALALGQAVVGAAMRGGGG
jgi:hydrogenase maturation protein HypF